MKPIIIVNFKAYKESAGGRAIKLAKICKKYSKEAEMICVPQAFDVKDVSKIIETYAQHIDPVEANRNTGWLTAFAAKEAGCIGVLVNHSEHRLDHATIEACIKKARENGMKSVVCAKDDEEAMLLASFKPDAIAVEPPELIAGKISVSEAKPEIVKKSVKKIKSVNDRIQVLCGAGIQNGRDVRKALELGTAGVLLSSSVVLAENPEKVMKDLTSYR